MKYRQEDLLAALSRCTEHEMNVEGGEETPLASYPIMCALLERAQRDGSGLSEAQKDFLCAYAGKCGPIS